jgi:hypothetical protein
MAGHTKSDAILFTAMPIVYDMQGYPHFVVDFAERKPDGARKTVQAAMLLVRSFFDEGEQRMTSIDDIDIGTPANGWTIRFTGVTGAQPPEAYIATYRNGEISYNEDPNRQAASMSERVWYAVDFAKGKGGSKGSGKTKNCTKGKLCGGSCIAKGRNCRIETNPTQKKAADALSKTSAGDAAKAKSAVKKEKKAKKAAAGPGDNIKKAKDSIKKPEEKTPDQEAVSYRQSPRYNSDLAEAIDKIDKLPLFASREQKLSAAQDAINLAAADLEKEIQLKRSNPEGYRISSIESADKGHDWVQPPLVNPPAQMNFNDANKAITITTGTPRSSDYKVTRIASPPLSAQQYEEYRNKYGPLAKELNQFAGSGDPVNNNDQVAQIARTQKVSESVARERVEAAQRFAGTRAYPEIRAADDGLTRYKNADDEIVSVSKQAQDDARRINEYIRDSPKYEGTIYRGLSDRGGNLKEMIDQIKSPEGLTIRSVSSFSSNPKVATDFANMRDEGVVIAVKSNRSGASIRNIALLPKEDEVIVPKGTRYRYVGERIENGITIYEVEEID